MSLFSVSFCVLSFFFFPLCKESYRGTWVSCSAEMPVMSEERENIQHLGRNNLRYFFEFLSHYFHQIHLPPFETVSCLTAGLAHCTQAASCPDTPLLFSSHFCSPAVKTRAGRLGCVCGCLFAVLIV